MEIQSAQKKMSEVKIKLSGKHIFNAPKIVPFILPLSSFHL